MAIDRDAIEQIEDLPILSIFVSDLDLDLWTVFERGLWIKAEVKVYTRYFAYVQRILSCVQNLDKLTHFTVESDYLDKKSYVLSKFN